MTIAIDATQLGLDFPIYSVKAQSLRNALFNASVGGRLLKTQNDIAVVRALTDLNFKLSEGDRLGILGHNGAGKTSLLKVLAGVYSPTAGKLEIKGRVTSMISMSIGLDPEASGLRNIRTLLLMQLLSKREIEERIPKILEFSGLGPFIHMPFKTYSAGMMARLTFAVGTEVDADILLMDEWMSAGDAAFRGQASERLERFVGAAKLLVIGTHDTNLVKQLCNKVLVLNGGRTEFYGQTRDYLD